MVYCTTFYFDLHIHNRRLSAIQETRKMYASSAKSHSEIDLANIDLEKEYSPMLSSNRDDPNDVINQFMQIGTEETVRVGKVYNRRNVSYGESNMESMDIYFKGVESDTPIFVFIHGGYWVMGDKSSSAVCVAPLVEQGYRVAILDYNLCPNVTLQELIQQIRKFLKFLLEYARETNAGKISLCGHSAGAHLIATLLQSECLDLPHAQLIKDAFLISGVYDLRELRDTEVGNPGNVLSIDEESAKTVSPILYTLPESTKNIQVHVLAAEYDSSTFRGQSEAFFKKLALEKVPTFHQVLPGYDHFTIVEEMRNEKSLITKYFIDSLIQIKRK